MFCSTSLPLSNCQIYSHWPPHLKSVSSTWLSNYYWLYCQDSAETWKDWPLCRHFHRGASSPRHFPLGIPQCLSLGRHLLHLPPPGALERASALGTSSTGWQTGRRGCVSPRTCAWKPSTCKNQAISNGCLWVTILRILSLACA